MKRFGWTLLVAVAVGLQWVGVLAAPGLPENQSTPSVRWTYQLQRARAHQRMKNTMYASTPDRAAVAVMCPALSDGRFGPPIALDLRGAFLTSDALHFAHKIHPTTLRRDKSNGTIIYPKHVHKTLRRYFGIENSLGAQRFPFHNTEDFAFFA